MKYHKEQTHQKAIQRMALPEKVVLPLQQHIGKPAKPVVSLKQKVLRGELIAQADSVVSAPVHSSISGEVIAIERLAHPVYGEGLSIVVKSDGEDLAHQDLRIDPRTEDEVKALAPEQLLNIIKLSGVVGMGGASFPTAVKLSPRQPVQDLIINGAECEPVLASDYRLMIEQHQRIVQGIGVIKSIIRPKRTVVAIEDNKPLAVKIFKDYEKQAGFKVHVLKTEYPQGGEKQLTQSILKKEVPRGKLPFDIGALVQNVSTAFAIYEAVYLNKPLYERVVTVAGTPLENPGNLLVRIGTPIEQLILACGVKEEIRKVIMGGPMMGIALSNLTAGVVKSTGGIIAFSQQEIVKNEDRVCCRCARCVDVCPVRIEPAMISIAVEKEKWDQARDYNIFDCIECGLCSYICPAKRDLVHLIRYGKSKLKNK